MRRERTAEVKDVPPAGALGLRDGPGPAGARAFVVEGCGGFHPVCHRPGASRAVAAQGVKVVRTVARSTLTP